MSWQDTLKAKKAKKLSPKQKKLDLNHNGVIDAQDFHIMNGSKKILKAQWDDPALYKEIKGLIYSGHIEPALYEYMEDIGQFKKEKPEAFKIYMEDIFDYINSKVSKEELLQYHRSHVTEDWLDEYEEDGLETLFGGPSKPSSHELGKKAYSKINKIVYEGVRKLGNPFHEGSTHQEGRVWRDEDR
tara:strand:- start:323 stop:880 length:558 start_codon:yes stop_codon:yes gene_type:complete